MCHRNTAKKKDNEASRKKPAEAGFFFLSSKNEIFVKAFR